MDCWSRNWHLYAVPQYQEEKKWALVPLAIQPETKIPLTRLLMPFASMLLSASLESLQAEGPQTSRALSSAFRRGSCRVEHLGSRSPGGTERSLRLVAQPTAALRFPPESRSAHPSWPQPGSFGIPKCVYGQYHTQWRTVVGKTPCVAYR